jgi:hypothetical protein
MNFIGAACGAAITYWHASIYTPVPIMAKWNGEVPSEVVLRARTTGNSGAGSPGGIAPDWSGRIRPSFGLVCDEQSWETIWRAWHDGEAPKIDFSCECVIVVVDPGGNPGKDLTCNGLMDAKVGLWYCGADLPAFQYSFLKIPQLPIRRVNGRPVQIIDCKSIEKWVERATPVS